MKRKPIPKKMRDEMAEDKFYKKCCIADSDCEGTIQWHHNLRFAGSNVNRKSCILPVCEHHHRIADRHDIRDKLNLIMAARMSDDEIEMYSKVIRYDLMRPMIIPWNPCPSISCYVS